PTFSFASFCDRPYASTNESDVPCVELVSFQDIQAGGGAFYDEIGCAGQESGRSSVGCDFQGVTRCRVCVFNRALYSIAILGGNEVPYVDCPCCVADTYGMGGDIECDFQYSAPPSRPPTLPPTEAPTPTAGK
ncbi:unnamed protein product, partial [Ascophyllum nodosum]